MFTVRQGVHLDIRTHLVLYCSPQACTSSLGVTGLGSLRPLAGAEWYVGHRNGETGMQTTCTHGPAFGKEPRPARPDYSRLNEIGRWTGQLCIDWQDIRQKGQAGRARRCSVVSGIPMDRQKAKARSLSLSL